MACRMSCGPLRTLPPRSPPRSSRSRVWWGVMGTPLMRGIWPHPSIWAPKMGVIWTTSLRRVMALKVYYVPLGHHGATKMCS